MKKLFLISLAISLIALTTKAQKGNPVLIETFSETGCGACAAYDSAFQAVVKANEDKVVLINYHCFYSLDSLYQYNKICDQKYVYYDIKGFPAAMINGEMPNSTSSHMTYITTPVIEKFYNTEKKFNFEITTKQTGKGNIHSANIEIKATPLTDFTDKDLRLYAVITENNIDYEKRFHTKSVNGINDFSHIMRSYLPDSAGTTIKSLKPGAVNTVKLSYVNDDLNIDYKEVQVVVFVRDVGSKKVLGVWMRKVGE